MPTRVHDALAELPGTAQLDFSLDADLLWQECALLERKRTEHATQQSRDGWRALPLRSVGGNPDRTDPGGPGLDEFSDTPWLAQAEYTRHVLTSIPAPLRSARLMLLEPGTRVPEHDEPLYGLQFGGVRLHVPMTTNPEAMVVIGGETHRWEPGSEHHGHTAEPRSSRGDR